MHKSILVLEESRMVHELFESALPEDYLNWEINHESLPDRYLQKAKETKPDIIFLSNQDQKRNYAIVKQLKASVVAAQTPILLLTSAKDKLDENLLQSIGVRGFVRKPFETATLQKQINLVLKEQERSKKKKPYDRFKDLNVVDDDLMDLIGGRSTLEVSMDDLEGELDPTLQLIPSDEANEESEETELLAMDDAEEQIQSEFIDEDDEIAVDLDYEEDEIDSEGTDSTYDEIELEELEDETDFMDLDDVKPTAVAEPNGQPVRLIKVVQAESSELRDPLLNQPEDKNDLGFMELQVLPFRTEKIKSHVVESITDDFDEEKFIKAHSPVELEHDFAAMDSGVKAYQVGNNDEIEIHHEEIIEDFYEGNDDLDDQDPVEEDLLELSIEGMEDELSDDAGSTDDEEAEVVAFEELEDSDDTLEEINIQDSGLSADLGEDDEESSLVIQEELEDSEQELSTIEQEDGTDVEIDFQNDPTMEISEAETSQQLFEGFEDREIDEDSLTDSELEKRRADQLDIDLEEIAAAGSEEASATIQEMIGFRQVMKAKYELPDDDLGIVPDSDEEINDDEDLLAEVESNLGEDDPLLAEVPEEFDFPEDQGDPFKALPGGGEDDSGELELLSDEENDDLSDDDIELLSDDESDDFLSDENDKLDDIDLTSDLKDELESETTDNAGEAFDDAELLSDQINKDDSDVMFEDPDQITEEEEEIFSPLDDDEDEFAADLLSDVNESEGDLDGSFEEIELLTDEEPGEEATSESLLEVDEDSDDDLDTLIIDEEDMDDELSLDAPDDPFIMKNGLSDTADDINAMTPESMEEIDFLPIDEDSDESDIELAVEIDSDDEDSLESETNEDETTDDSIDDIDFLPVDEEEALSETSDIDEIPFIGADEEFKVDGEESDDEIDFLPADLEMEDDDEELPEPEAELLDQEILTSPVDSLDDTGEIMIEVPQETFEMNDFNVRDITSDEGESSLSERQEEEEEQEYNLMEGIETVKAAEGGTSQEPELESYENIELPTMDEDLPDLPPILGVDQIGEEEPASEPGGLSDSRKSDIRLLQNEYDFDEFDSDHGIIGVVEKHGNSTGAISASDRDEIKRQVKKAANSLTPEFRKKLSEMIEGVVSETVHNTLQERLPGMVEKLLHEELGD